MKCTRKCLTGTWAVGAEGVRRDLRCAAQSDSSSTRSETYEVNVDGVKDEDDDGRSGEVSFSGSFCVKEAMFWQFSSGSKS